MFDTAGQNWENVYMSLISREIQTHDYDDPCPSANPINMVCIDYPTQAMVLWFVESSPLSDLKQQSLNEHVSLLVEQYWLKIWWCW